jgi:hypothetical protein
VSTTATIVEPFNDDLLVPDSAARRERARHRAFSVRDGDAIGIPEPERATEQGIRVAALRRAAPKFSRGMIEAQNNAVDVALVNADGKNIQPMIGEIKRIGSLDRRRGRQ